MPYLLNSPILTAYGHWRFEGPLTLEQVRQSLAEGFISAIGHPGTAQVLGALLGLDVPVNRIAIAMQPGEQAIVFRLLARMEEGAVLDADALMRLPYELSRLTRID